MALAHPDDPPDDPSGSVGIRLDRGSTQREQARSVWSRPDRRPASGYGSGGQAMAVLAAAAPCGPAPGRTSGVAVDGLCCRLSTVALPRGCTTLPPSGVSAAPGRRWLPVSTSRVHRRSPEHGRDTAAAGHRPSTPLRRLRQRHRLAPADTARVSGVGPERPPPGGAVWTAGRWPPSGFPVGCGAGRCKRPRSTAASENRGRCPAGTLPQSAGSAATRTGRRRGGRWRGAATAGTRGRVGGRAGRRAGRAKVMAGRSNASVSWAVSPPSRRPDGSPRCQPATTERGSRLWVDPDLGPGVGRPGAQLHRQVR
jgi:hypothetical protein